MEMRKEGRGGAGAVTGVTGGAHRAKQIVIHEQLEPCARRPHLNSQSLPALEQLHFYIARPHVGAHWKTDHYLPGCARSMRRNASRSAGYAGMLDHWLQRWLHAQPCFTIAQVCMCAMLHHSTPVKDSHVRTSTPHARVYALVNASRASTGN